MGSRAIIYYLVTTVLAAILGIILVTIIHPGDPKSRHEIARGESKVHRENGQLL